MDIVLIVLAVIVLIAVVGYIVLKSNESDTEGQDAIDTEKERLGLSPEDSLNDPNLYVVEDGEAEYVVQPEDVTIVEAPAQDEAAIVTADGQVVNSQ